jgi:predicted transposase YbfD/YdcC
VQWVEAVVTVTKGQLVANAGKTARRIYDKTCGKADYLLRVKANQAQLRQAKDTWFVHGDQHDVHNMTMNYHETVRKMRCRVEMRRCWAIADPLALEPIRHDDGWADLQTIVRVQRTTRTRDTTTHETAYPITSLPLDAHRSLAATRHHWAIENSFHWVLDVTFGADLSRIRIAERAANRAVRHTIALNLLKHGKTRSSLKQKRFRAAMDNSFLRQLLTQV